MLDSTCILLLFSRLRPQTATIDESKILWRARPQIFDDTTTLFAFPTHRSVARRRARFAAERRRAPHEFATVSQNGAPAALKWAQTTPADPRIRLGSVKNWEVECEGGW